MATPSIIPRNEKTDITFKKPSFLLGFKFLIAINFSTAVNNLIFNIKMYLDKNNQNLDN